MDGKVPYGRGGKDRMGREVKPRRKPGEGKKEGKSERRALRNTAVKYIKPKLWLAVIIKRDV